MSNEIIVGGTHRTVDNRTETFKQRHAAWKMLDETRAAKILNKENPTESYAQNIAPDLTAILETAHRAICDAYVKCISRRVLPEGQQLSIAEDVKMPGVTAKTHARWVHDRYTPAAHAMKFWITKCERPGANYSDSMWILKNIRMDKWYFVSDKKLCPNSHDDFRGFCRMEPVARLRQLLKFPIEQFGFDWSRFAIAWPAPPNLSNDFWRDAETWERYYVALVAAMAKFVDLLNDQPGVDKRQ